MTIPTVVHYTLPRGSRALDSNSTESLSAVLPDAVFPYELLQPMPVAKRNRALELAIGVHPSHPLVDVRRRSVLFKGKIRYHDSAPASLLGSSRTVHHLGPSGQSLTGFMTWLGRPSSEAEGWVIAHVL